MCTDLLKIAIPLLFFAGCAPDKKEAPLRGQAMGTSWSVTLHGKQPSISITQISCVIEPIEAMASAWREESFLNRFNKSTSTAPIPCPPEIVEMVRFAIDLHQKTDGAYDITVAPIVRALGFGPKNDVPSSPQTYGSRHLTVTDSTLQKAIPSLQIDLNSIAKGYAVDQIADYLDAKGCSDYLIEFGGELRAAGKKWKIGIERTDPASIGTIAEVIELQNQSITTSGTYRHFKDSPKTSHIIDPRTEAPVKHNCLAVSVISPTCMEADAWATALLVLGSEAGQKLARQCGIQAIFPKN